MKKWYVTSVFFGGASFLLAGLILAKTTVLFRFPSWLPLPDSPTASFFFIFLLLALGNAAFSWGIRHIERIPYADTEQMI